MFCRLEFVYLAFLDEILFGSSKNHVQSSATPVSALTEIQPEHRMGHQGYLSDNKNHIYFGGRQQGHDVHHREKARPLRFIHTK